MLDSETSSECGARLYKRTMPQGCGSEREKYSRFETLVETRLLALSRLLTGTMLRNLNLRFPEVEPRHGNVRPHPMKRQRRCWLGGSSLMMVVQN